MNDSGCDEVGALDEPNRLDQLLDEVERGESFVITRYGRPVAQLVPYIAFDSERARAAVDALLHFPGGRLPAGVTIRQLIDEGRERRC
jgi:prevent-host-death family protein